MALSTIPFSALSADASNQGVNFRNLIINGDMSIAQRGTSFTCSNSTGSKYTLDRFQYIDVDTPDSVYTITPSTDVPSGQGFAKSLKVDVTTADASLDSSDGTQIQQSIEAQNLQHLKIGTSSAESLTLSFWVKSNKTGTYVVRLLQPDSSSRMVSFAYTISSASTWEKKTISIPADTSGNINNDNGSGLNISWWLSAGSSYTSGSLASTWQAYSNGDSAVGQVNLADNTANEWYITGVQLEVGTSASDFEFLPYDVNLQRCQRYFEILSIKQASQENEIMNMISFNASQIYGTYQFRVEKRNDPSLVVDNGTNYFRYYRQGGFENFSAIGLDNSSLHQASLYGAGLSLTSGEGGFVRWVNNASTNDKVAFDSGI